MDINEKALELHKQWNGKLTTEAKSAVKTREDLSLAYTPGVAEPCKVIAKDPAAAYTYTMKANTVAVVSDGSAVLGLGNIGALAAMPVMEGKCVLFKEFADSIGADVDMNQMYGTLYNKALEGDADCGGILSYGNYAGEPITNVEKGRPMVVRTPETKFTLANFMRSHLYTALGVIKVGMDILTKDEGVEIDTVLGHGGLFKTKGVGQKILAGSIDAPVSVMETAGEGGAWGIALLASYMINKEENETLEDYLDAKVFAGNAGTKMDPDPADVAGFEVFTERYKKGLPIERAAVESLK